MRHRLFSVTRGCAMCGALSTLLFMTIEASAQVGFPPPSRLVRVDIDLLKQLPLSSVIYLSTLRAYRAAGFLPLNGNAAVVAQSTPDGPTAADVDVHGLGTRAGLGTRLTPSAKWVIASSDLTNDTEQDVEPTVVAQVSGSTTFAATYIKVTPSAFRNYYKSPTYGVGGQLAMPSAGYGWAGNPGDYLLTGDPLMDTSPAGDAYFPRMYCVGITGAGAAFTPPSGIAVWRTADGVSWDPPRPVVSANTSVPFYDKPAIAVSRASVSPGEVYITYVAYFSTTPGQQEIHVARSYDGASSFPQDVCIPANYAGTCARGNFGTPQVLVDKYGYVYTFFADLTYNIVYRSSSTTRGVSWTLPEAVTDGNRRFLGNNTPRLTGELQAVTTLSAAYDPYLHRLAVVWHERENPYAAPPGPVDIWIATKGAGEAWDVHALDVPRSGDQFMPSIASDTGGGFLVTYYSRHTDPSNLRYRQYDFYVDAHGNPIYAHPLEEVSSFASHPNLFGDAEAGFIGDYQHVSWHSSLGTFQNVWTGRQSTTEPSPLNIWFGRIQ